MPDQCTNAHKMRWYCVLQCLGNALIVKKKLNRARCTRSPLEYAIFLSNNRTQLSMGIFELPSDFLAPIVQAMIVPPEVTDATDSKIDTAHFTPASESHLRHHVRTRAAGRATSLVCDRGPAVRNLIGKGFSAPSSMRGLRAGPARCLPPTSVRRVRGATGSHPPVP